MKIIQISASYKPAYIYGGPIMSVSMLCESIQKNSKIIDLEVLTTTANGKTELVLSPNEIIEVDGVKVTYFPRITKDHTHFSPALLRNLNSKIRSFLSQKKLNNESHLVIHIHAWWNLVSILSCLIAKFNHATVVLSPRGMLTEYTLGSRNSLIKKIIHQTIGKKLLRYCHIHATSEKEKIDILKFVRPKSITVIPNLVRIHQSSAIKNARVKSSQFKLLFLSRIDAKKGLENLFEALKDLEIDWHLTIAGDGSSKYIDLLKKQTVELQIENRITWLGHVANDEKFDLFYENDLFVLISHNENFANVVIESLSVGTPVLVSTDVGLSNYIEENRLGWITKSTPTAISKAILRISKDRLTWYHIAKLAPQIITRDFDEELLSNRYISLYENSIRSS